MKHRQQTRPARTGGCPAGLMSRPLGRRLLLLGLCLCLWLPVSRARSLASPGQPSLELLQSQPAPEEEALLLLLSAETSDASQRLSKRSGISDQRLAEIQMIRALRKQLEQAARSAASASSAPS